MITLYCPRCDKWRPEGEFVVIADNVSPGTISTSDSQELVVALLRHRPCGRFIWVPPKVAQAMT